MKGRIRLALWAVIVVVTSLWATPTGAQEGVGPTIVVDAAWNGLVRAPGWTELRVTVANEGEAWEGSLRILDEAKEITYHLPLSLPAHSRKAYRLPLYVTEPRQIEVALDPPPAEADPALRLRSAPTSARVCAVLDSLGAPALTLGQDEGCDEVTVVQNVHALPETSMTWDTIDLLVFTEPAVDLTEAQEEALTAWVVAGGHLVHLEGEGRAVQGLPAPLNRAGSVGRGRVDLIGAGTERGLARLWEDDPIPATAFPIRQELFSAVSPAPYSIMQLPLSELPSLWRWLLLFPLYVILVGPGSWFVVRRLDRPVLAWVLLPVGILIGVGLLYLSLSGTFSRTFPLTHETALVWVPDRRFPARVMQSTASFAPRVRQLEWTTEASPRPLLGAYGTGTNAYNSGTPYPMQVTWQGRGGARVEAYPHLGPLTWAVEGLTPAPEVRVELQLRGDASTPVFEGTVESDVSLREPTLFLDNAYHLPLTDVITASVPVTVKRPLTDTSNINSVSPCVDLDLAYRPGPYAPTLPREMPGNVAPSLPPVCYLTGMMEGVPYPARDLKGTRVSESCLIMTVPCPAREEGPVVLQAFPTETMSNGWLEPTGKVHVLPPHTIVAYALPSFLSLEGVEKVTIDVHTRNGASPVEGLQKIEVWDRTAERWVPLPLPRATGQLTLEGDEAARFFHPREGLRLSFTPIPGSDPNPVQITVMARGEW
jgi:hypothetical protein